MVQYGGRSYHIHVGTYICITYHYIARAMHYLDHFTPCKWCSIEEGGIHALLRPFYCMQMVQYGGRSWHRYTGWTRFLTPSIVQVTLSPTFSWPSTDPTWSTYPPRTCVFFTANSVLWNVESETPLIRALMGLRRVSYSWRVAFWNSKRCRLIDVVQWHTYVEVHKHIQCIYILHHQSWIEIRCHISGHLLHHRNTSGQVARPPAVRSLSQRQTRYCSVGQSLCPRRSQML